VSIEERALKLAIEYEAKNGWKAEDVHREHLPYDIVSKKNGQVKYIEVKGMREKRPYIEVSEALLRNMGRKIGDYYIYNVYNLENKPRLRIIDPETLFTHLKTWVKFYFRFAGTNIPEIDLSKPSAKPTFLGRR